MHFPENVAEHFAFDQFELVQIGGINKHKMQFTVEIPDGNRCCVNYQLQLAPAFFAALFRLFQFSYIHHSGPIHHCPPIVIGTGNTGKLHIQGGTALLFQF